jgi:hypothetical protein
LADILDCVDLQVVSSNNVSETVSVSFLMWRDKVRHPTQLGPLSETVLNPGKTGYMKSSKYN